MAQPTPHLVVLGGPIGAGKSTTAPQFLVGALQVTEFVNADVIAQGLSAFRSEEAAITAGRIMLQRLRQLARQRATFAFETTMASRTFAPWLESLRKQGYSIHMLFLWLPSPEMAIARVAERVRLGGHDVPKATVRRRYGAGWNNFLDLYMPLATSWRVYDNSVLSSPRLVALQTSRAALQVSARMVWDTFRRGHSRDG
jgi:predicted ABC-type ATPase